MNEELITSAISFLRDPNVSTSPLNKKIEFLESKGLNQEEIEEALKRASGSASTSSTSVSSPSYSHQAVPNMAHPPPPLDYYPLAPLVPERTWKDYFIMATATAGISYGLYQVVSRYLIPTIIPPGQSRVNEDKEKIDEEFIKIDKVLEQMALEQKEIKDANEAKLKDIEVVIGNVNDFLSKYNKDKLQFDDDLRLMKLEIDSLQNTLEKNLNLTKENIHDELSDVSEELKSLKSLIKARSADTLGMDRKVTSVSSIPSASEILRKAKLANGSTPPKSEVLPSASPVPENTKTEEKQSAAPASQTFESWKNPGIPDWQLKHREEEEKILAANVAANATANSSTNATDSPVGAPASASEPGIPSWQQSMKQWGNTTEEDNLVKESIESVGVPAWQLNNK